MAKVKRCPQCGRLVSSGASSCKYCGAALDGSAAVSSAAPAPSQPDPTEAPAVVPTDRAAVPHAVSAAATDISQSLASGISSLRSKAAAVKARMEKEKSEVEAEKPEATAPAETAQPASTPPTVPEAPANPAPQPAAPQPAPQAAPQPPIYVSENPKSNKGLIITILVAAVLLVGGGIAAALILKDNGSDKKAVPENTVQKTGTTSETVSANVAEEPEPEEADPVKHYSINTIMSGYPIIVKLDITPDGEVTGKYAYVSTLKKYGDRPSSWFTLKGVASGDELVMDVSHPDHGNFERMEVTLTGEGDKASLNGVNTNYNTYQYFYVGSEKKPVKYYDEY